MALTAASTNHEDPGDREDHGDHAVGSRRLRWDDVFPGSEKREHRSVNDSVESYCRQIEAYLCRKNDGHLIRIVGPAFDRVCSWASRGVPLAVACRGIDRYFERYYAKGPRRRPVRVEFCEADVLDVFDEWRRAVGVAGLAGPGDADATPNAAGDAGGAGRKRESLAAHLDRVVARLTVRRAGEDRSLDGAIDEIVRELDAARAGAKGLRGSARDGLLERLRGLDARLLAAARAACDENTLRQLGDEADAELAPFRSRLRPQAYAQSRQACLDRLIRDYARLPAIAFD